MVAEENTRFKGASLVVPYLALSSKDQALLDKFKPVAKILNKVMPTFRINARKGRPLKKWILNFADDPLYEGGSICCHNLINNDRQLKYFHEQVADKVKTPFLMILGGKDTLVCNKTAKDFFENNEGKDKDLIVYDDADHCILQDAEYWPTVALDVIGWSNTHR